MLFKKLVISATRKTINKGSGILDPPGRHAYIENLFLHIGLPKTGTTLIQTYCAQNRKVLARHGILYPKAGLPGLGRFAPL